MTWLGVIFVLCTPILLALIQGSTVLRMQEDDQGAGEQS